MRIKISLGVPKIGFRTFFWYKYCMQNNYYRIGTVFYYFYKCFSFFKGRWTSLSEAFHHEVSSHSHEDSLYCQVAHNLNL
jgi:hypothetical protein